VVPHRHRVAQRAILERHPDVAHTYASATELRDDRVNASPESLGSPTGVYGPPDLCLRYLRDAYWNFWPSGLLIRRNAFRASGGFVEALGAWQHWEDYFYACALALNESAYVLDEPLVDYRVHSASCSSRARMTGESIVDERMGIEWFLRHLATDHRRSLPLELLTALEDRLTRNAHAFAAALPGYPAFTVSSGLYAPAVLEGLVSVLRTAPCQGPSAATA
jgi:hypothetical protein